MRVIKKIPRFFAITAVMIVFVTSVINRISPVKAVCRMVPAALIFYILGMGISRMIINDLSQKHTKGKQIDAMVGEDEDFRELDAPVIDDTKEEVVGRG